MEKPESLNAILERSTKKETDVSDLKEKKEVVIDENRLIIGINDKNKDLFIPEKSRFLNTIVIGTKGTGKTTSVLPMFVEQDLKRKNAGVTIISSSKEMSYNLYSLAKKYKRKINFIKPSINNEVTNHFLWLKDYNYDYINENIINYKEAIKKKEVVIIDMEIMKYKSDALKAVAMLLLQLRLDIQETDITQRCPHFLYVDDAYYYLKFLEDLLSFSDNFNLGITLFMQSRNQFITRTKDFTPMINNNIRNTMLLNNITIEDYDYYKLKFPDKTINEFFSREFNSMLYETIDAMGIRRVGITKFKKLLIGDWNELEQKSKRIRASLLKEKRKEREFELKEKYKKSLEIQKSVEDIKQTKTSNIPTKEPKPLDKTLMTDLTSSETLNIKPREFNIKQQKSLNVTGAKPNFNPPKTNYDIALEHTKKKQINLLEELEDLGSIKPQKKEEINFNNKQNNKHEIELIHSKKSEDKKTQQENKDNIEKHQNTVQQSKNTENTKQDIIQKDVTSDKKVEDVQNIEQIEPKMITESINSIEIQKKKEEEAIRIQKEIDEKIQEQILNEEKERKRLVATRIFNNYNDNIDYCDEIFDFQYE